MRASIRPFTALISGAITLAVAVTAASPAAAAVTSARPVAKPSPYFVGGFVPSGKTITAASQLGKIRAFSAEALPDSVDLRANAPAVGNQGSIGACVAWTIGYSIMGYYAKVSGGTGAPYAPLYLYMRSLNGGVAPNSGLIPENALNVAQKTGVDTQADYFQGTTNYSTKPTDAEIANAASYRLTGWSTLWSGPSNQGATGQLMIERALASGSPVAIGFPVYSDFQALKSGQIYTGVSGNYLGGHMVAAYAYDSKGLWIRNSWTTGWGTNGDAQLSWAFVNKMVMAAFSISGVTTPASEKVSVPTVVGLSAKTGSTLGGGTVTITGSNLANASAVKFGATAASFTTSVVNGVTQLVATIPTGVVGTVDVTVTNSAGTSVGSTASKFTYAAPLPSVTAVSPTSVSSAGGSTVTLTGTALTGTTAVRVGTAPATSFKVLSDTSLTFVAPKTTAGKLHVTVTTASGASKNVDADFVTAVNPPAPTVTRLSVNQAKTTAVATTVTVTGTGFGGTTAVTVGGMRATYVAKSETELTVTVPKHAAGTGNIQVTTPYATSAVTDANAFTWVLPAAPTLASSSASTGSAKQNTVVTLTGTGFTGATSVLVGTISVPASALSDTSIRVTLPVAKAAGAVTIRVVGPGGTSNDVQYLYV